MNTLIKKLISWLPKNIGAMIGIGQAFLKVGKEICTLLLDIVAPIIPGNKDDIIIAAVRNVFNIVDAWMEKIKVFLLKVGI